jgi:hypothetical protein
MDLATNITPATVTGQQEKQLLRIFNSRTRGAFFEADQRRHCESD